MLFGVYSLQKKETTDSIVPKKNTRNDSAIEHMIMITAILIIEDQKTDMVIRQ